MTDIDAESYDAIAKESCQSRIMGLLYFIKNVEPLLVKIKADLSKYLMSK